MLRRADEMCRRRLKKELAGTKRFANNLANARFSVSSRVLGDARLAHTGTDVVEANAFVEPDELEPEQRHTYRAAARGYLHLFGERPGQTHDLGWTTELPDLGIDLVCDPGLTLTLPDGTHELRVLKIGRRSGTPLVDAVELRCALVRTEHWATGHIRIVAADLIELETDEFVPDTDSAREEAHAWIASRVELVQNHAADGRANPGSDCGWCPFIASCDKVK